MGARVANVVWTVCRSAGGLGIGRREQAAQMALQLAPDIVGGSREDVGGEMGLAALPTGALEVGLHRRHQPAMVIGDHQIDALQPALLQA